MGSRTTAWDGHTGGQHSHSERDRVYKRRVLLVLGSTVYILMTFINGIGAVFRPVSGQEVGQRNRW